MNECPLSIETVALIRRALERSWSEKTSICYNPDIAPLSYGQCAPTAIVVFETLGGEILRTEVAKKDGSTIRHFYNRIKRCRHDFTADQFAIPNYWCELVYKDLASSVEEAGTETLSSQLEAMRSAFKKAIEQEEMQANEVPQLN